MPLSPVRLFVLGVLNEGESHGYEVKERAKQWNLELWTEIGYGSIYHALTMLAREGLIEEVGTEQRGTRPPRMVYRITDRGREEFLRLVRETSRSGYQEKHPINLAVTFLNRLTAAERVRLLTERLRALQERRDAVASRRARYLEAGDLPPSVLATLDHDLGHTEFEIRWTENLLAQVSSWPGSPRDG